MNPIAATDLDRTLIYSSAARARLGPDAPDAVCVEWQHGNPAAFMTRRAAFLLAELASNALFVPVTTRTREQYARLRLPVPVPRFAVVANGGGLLVDGVPDAAWDAEVRRRVSRCAPLARVSNHVQRWCRPDWTRSVREAAGLFVYAVVEPALLPRDALEGLEEWSGAHGWTVSLQGRKLYAVPDALTKSAAVREIARRADARLLAAAGDALLDRDLLLAAERGIHPRHGELFERGFAAGTVTCTAAGGILAGEEIVAFLLAAVAGWAPVRRAL